VVQRVQRAVCEVDGEVTGQIGAGLLLFVGVGREDLARDDAGGSAARARAVRSPAVTLADKVAELRIFRDSEGKSNLSLLETGGAALVISQFTLYADCRKGRRPSFTDAADPGPAEAMVEEFRAALEHRGVRTATGRFGAHMVVTLVNDGPYTIVLDSDVLAGPRAGRRGAPGGHTCGSPTPGGRTSGEATRADSAVGVAATTEIPGS
jgi:D-tyrosyl-tRNA(Tyr) deacylase